MLEGSNDVTDEKTVGGARAYEVGRLIDESDGFLGCTPHVAAGALHDVKKKALTVEEAKKHVSKWLAGEVATSGQKEES